MKIRLLATILALAVAAQACHAQTFDFTGKEFIGKLNAELTADGGDTVRGCVRTGENYPPIGVLTACVFNDAVFQRSAALFGGPVQMKETLAYTELSGRVSRIAIVNVARDALIYDHFPVQVGAIVKTLDPAMKPDDVAMEERKIGLAFGLDAPACRDDILDAFTVLCTKGESSLGYTFLPRID